MAARLLYTNAVMNPGYTLTVSSEDSGAPRSWLRNEARGQRWRSKLGWNIIAGVNDAIDFNRGGVKLAEVAPGNYPTGAALESAIGTALEAADAPPVWVTDYNASHLFGIGAGATSFDLLFGTGANKARSIAKDLGYTETDKTGGTAYYGEAASYKSREWIKLDCGLAVPITAGILLDHNLGAGGTVKAQANATDAWGAPSVNQTLAGDSIIRIGFFAGGSYRYQRILIDDVTANTLGYSEAGIAYLGSYTEPSVTYSCEYEKAWEEFSALAHAMSSGSRAASVLRRYIGNNLKNSIFRPVIDDIFSNLINTRIIQPNANIGYKNEFMQQVTSIVMPF